MTAALEGGKDLVPILQEAGWVLGPVWTGEKSRPHRDSIPDRSARSQSLYRLSYPTHSWFRTLLIKFDPECEIKWAVGDSPHVKPLVVAFQSLGSILSSAVYHVT